MKILVKLSISKGEFPEHIHKSEITEYVLQKMKDGLFDHISKNFNNTLVCDHNTSEVSMKCIFIQDADGFIDKVNKLLDDPGASKNDFKEKLIHLLDNQ